MEYVQQLLFLIFLLISGNSAVAQHNLTFMLVTSYGQFGFNSSGIIPAADMALEGINNNPKILPDYNLMYGTVRDSQVIKLYMYVYIILTCMYANHLLRLYNRVLC